MFKLLVGDAIEQLKTLPDKSINTCVTSPPYYGLRDYGIDNQIGLEETPDDYIERLVDVFREVKRVLRDDGILWVNIGDSYVGRSNGGTKIQGNDEFNKNRPSREETKLPPKRVPPGCKPKDLTGIPWMLAFALRNDGWYLRQDIIWAKNNPMPESVKDRCTRSHEYVFMLTKSKKYWFDHEAMQEDAVSRSGAGAKYGKRNKRDVWNCSVAITKEAHFAVFPKELIEPCILAGCPENGLVLDPFSGSGTSGIVAVNNSRNFIGVELNPEYISITERRVEKECKDVTVLVQDVIGRVEGRL